MESDAEKRSRSSSSSSSSDSERGQSRPKAAHPTLRRSESPQKQEYDRATPRPPSQNAGDSQLHIVRKQKTRSAPTRPQSMMSRSADLIYLQKELIRIERQMERDRRINMEKKAALQPYKPYTWNNLAPYYNTDTVRYLLRMPVPVRQGYSTRMTAMGMVDPAVSWKMDHSLNPYTPSRPELHRRHMRRTRSAVVEDSRKNNEIISPQYPELRQRRDYSATYGRQSTKLPAVSTKKQPQYAAYYPQTKSKSPRRSAHY